MDIDLLVNRPEHIEDVAKMVYKKFVIPTSSKKTYEEVVDFFKETYADIFPITFIANVDGQCVGTVSVFGDLSKIERSEMIETLFGFVLACICVVDMAYDFLK